MKNVTISMEDDLLSWARVEAAKRGESVSRFVGGLVTERRRQGPPASQREALEKFLSGPALALSDENGDLPRGKDRYEPVLRRHEHPDLPAGPEVADEGRDRARVGRSRR